MRQGAVSDTPTKYPRNLGSLEGFWSVGPLSQAAPFRFLSTVNGSAVGRRLGWIYQFTGQHAWLIGQSAPALWQQAEADTLGRSRCGPALLPHIHKSIGASITGVATLRTNG